MGRRFITARDIDDLLDRGATELQVDATTVLTDLAREHARDRGVTIRSGGAGSPVAAPPAAAGPRAAAASAPAAGSPGAASSSSREGPTRRQLRAAVRAAVVEEFGTTPPGIDVAIGRVFDRFGLAD